MGPIGFITALNHYMKSACMRYNTHISQSPVWARSVKKTLLINISDVRTKTVLSNNDWENISIRTLTKNVQSELYLFRSIVKERL